MLELLKFYFESSTKFNIQSPFLYQFINSCIENRDQYYAFQKIKHWTHLNPALETHGRIIHKMVNFLKPERSVIIGKNIELSWYAKLADTRKDVVFINSREKIKSPETKLHNFIDRPKIELHHINELASVIEGAKKTILIIEDLHPLITQMLEKSLSKEHQKLVIYCINKHKHTSTNAFWKELQSYRSNGLFVDFFKYGIFFGLPELSNEKISYVPYPLKPWNIGLFGK